MKTKFFFPIVALATMAAMTGCDENSWNNDYLDGYDDTVNRTQEEAVEYTFTSANYKSIASNTTNKELAEKNGVSAELAAVGSKGCFNEKVSARDYIPAFLNSTSNPFYTLSDGSSIKITYKTESGLPECVYDAPAAELLTVDEEFYQEVWGSDEDYVNAFAPSHPASKSLPYFLTDRYDDAEAGAYAIVTYAQSEQEPVFGNTGGGDTPEPWAMSSVVGTIVPDQEVEIKGVVTGACGSGFTLTDKTGTIFVYMGSGFDPATYAVGTQINLTGSSTSYKNNLQIATGAVIEVVGSQEYKYPAPVIYDAASLDATLSRPANVTAVYCQMTGTVAVSGNNINIVLSDEATAKGSVYYATDEQKALLADGEVFTVTGWYVSISGSRYCNIVVTDLTKGAKAAASRVVKAPAVEVPVTDYCAVYSFDGSKWSVPANFAVLNPGDYVDMGQRSNLTPAQAKQYLPVYLSQKYPYASADDVRYVLYKCYSSGSTNYACSMYTFDGTTWNLSDGITEETGQFVRNHGKWIYNPDVTITLPAGRGQAFSATYYQACTDWVFENICVPLGDTDIKSGKFYVTSYGNNEYYSGTSAYQNNVDLRAGSARSQYPAGWEGYTDEEIVETEKSRFCLQVLPAVLSKMHADATPIDGLELHYYVNFSSYNGSATNSHQVTYKVTAPGTFEFVECNWWEDGQPVMGINK